MKKYFLLLALLVGMTVSACGTDDETPIPQEPSTEQPGGGDDDNGGGNDDDETPDPVKPTPGTNGRYLVLFTSRTGNTERMAEAIRTTLDCDLLEVEPAVAFDDDYQGMLERAREELAGIRNGNYPAIKTSVESLDDYDVVFVGYPIWHGSMATPMQTFLHEHAAKLAGKRIALFASSGSSPISTSVSEARALCPDADFTETLHLTSSTLSQIQSHIASWLERLGLGKEDDDNNNEPDMNTNRISIKAGSTTFTATLVDNSSTRALKELLAEGDLTISMSDYGNMEKVGPIGRSLPRNDENITTQAGDLILYQGNSFVIYYAPNTWSFTRLGHIDGATRENLLAALGSGSVTVTLSLE